MLSDVLKLRVSHHWVGKCGAGLLVTAHICCLLNTEWTSYSLSVSHRLLVITPASLC